MSYIYSTPSSPHYQCDRHSRESSSALLFRVVERRVIVNRRTFSFWQPWHSGIATEKRSLSDRTSVSWSHMSLSAMKCMSLIDLIPTHISSTLFPLRFLNAFNMSSLDNTASENKLCFPNARISPLLSVLYRIVLQTWPSVAWRAFVGFGWLNTCIWNVSQSMARICPLQLIEVFSSFRQTTRLSSLQSFAAQRKISQQNSFKALGSIEDLKISSQTNSCSLLGSHDCSPEQSGGSIVQEVDVLIGECVELLPVKRRFRYCRPLYSEIGTGSWLGKGVFW